MALRIRRGTEAQRTSILPENGELLYVTDHVATGSSALWIGDGLTNGGNPVSGIEAGTVNALARYATDGSAVSPTSSLTWDETFNAMRIDNGSLTITAGNGPRSLLNLTSFVGNTSASNFLYFSKARGTESLPQPLLLNDPIATFSFSAYDGLTTSAKASISPYISLAPTLSGTPFNITFSGKVQVQTFYDVSFTMLSQATAPAVSSSYTVAGNGNNNYNGTFIVSASTTTSITLRYPTDPGTFGGGTTQAIAKPVFPTAINFSTTTSSGNVAKTVKFFNNGRLFVGPQIADAVNGVSDPAFTGQLAITSIAVDTNFAETNSVALTRSYSSTSASQYSIHSRFRGSVLSPLALQSGDIIHGIHFNGYDGAASRGVARIRAVVDGSVSSGVVPGKLVFLTQNSSGAIVEALNIDSTQKATFSGRISVPDGTASSPSIAFTTDGGVDTGFSHPGDGVVVVSSNANEVARFDGGGIRSSGFIKVANVNGTLPSPPEAGMIVLDGTTFKGYNGSSWVTLG